MEVSFLSFLSFLFWTEDISTLTQPGSSRQTCMVSKRPNPRFRDSGACHNQLPIATATRLGIALLLLGDAITQNRRQRCGARDRSSCDIHHMVMMMLMVEGSG